MFFISIIGVSVAPILVFLALYVQTQTKENAPVPTFDILFTNTNLYLVLLIGVPLYGVITAYLFNREYAEDTLKNILTIPVPKTKFLISKTIALFLWILFLTVITWIIGILIGTIGGLQGFSVEMMITSFRQSLLAGIFLFLLSSPIIFITLVTKNYVPPIILTIVITMMNVITAESKYKDLLPWSAALDIANGTLLPTYPALYSYISIIATCFIGFFVSFMYFKKTDVQ